MSLTVRDPTSDVPAEDRLARLSELAGAVLEAAQQLQVSAKAATEARATAPASRAERCAALIGDLLSSEVVDGREVAVRAAELGCDLSLGAQVLCVELHVDRPSYVASLIADGCEEALLHTRDSSRPLRLYAVLPCTGTCIAGSVGAVRSLTQRIAPYGVVGVSSFEADASGLGRALREAELVLDLIRTSDERIAEDIGSGTYRLLLRMLASSPNEMRAFYESSVGPVVDYDEQNQTELVNTLRAYLDSDCNMNATAASVYAHRHTVASRLERIRELTGLDPLRHQDREQLSLGLKVYRLLAPQLSPGARAAAPA
jgi:PucR C-terminal helix-turn-helix domain/GGDEF-like domain